MRREKRYIVQNAIRAVIDRLESRLLLSGTGLNDAVYHGNAAYTTAGITVPNPNPNAALTDATVGGGNGAASSVAAYAASHTPSYTFVNTYDRFLYSGGSDEGTSGFLANGVFGGTGDQAGAAMSDAADVDDTIFDAEGYFQTPSANDSGTYTLTLPATGGSGGVDDIVAVYVGGNGTPGSGTLVGSSGWQGASAGLPSFQFTVPAAPNTSAPANVPIEIIYGNGFGGAFLNAVSGSNPQTSVLIKDPSGTQVTTYNTTATNEPHPATPVLSDTTGNSTVQLSWATTPLASTYSVYRYVTSAGSPSATKLASGITAAAYGPDARANDAVTYSDTTAADGTAYCYYITADNQAGSTQSNTVSATAAAALIPGLTVSVFHGNNAYSAQYLPNPNPNSGFTGPSGPTMVGVTGTASYAAGNTPNYTFVDTNDAFTFSGGSGASTSAFLGADAAGAALADPANVNNTIFDAKGYFQTPTVNDAGTYTVTLGTSDDLVAVYVGGNGTSESGTLVAANGYQGNIGGAYQITLPAGPTLSQPATIPIEVLYANGGGGAFLNGVSITDPHSTKITTFETAIGVTFAPSNLPPPSAPTLTDNVGSNTVLLNWNAVPLATSYSVYRYLASSPSSTAVQLGSASSATAYTDTSAANQTSYKYYVLASDGAGSTSSNTITATPEPAATGPVTLLNATRNTATSVQLSWTAPSLGTDYTVTRSTTSGGTQTNLTPTPITATTFTDTSAVSGTSYYYTVTSVNAQGGQPSPPDVAFAGAGDGWSADYYASNTADPGGSGNTKPLTGDASNAVLGFERIDPTISVLSNTPPGWNSIQTNAGGSAQNDFAVRWVGYVEAPVTGYYSFSVNAVDDKEDITVYDPNHLTSGQPTPVPISANAGFTMTGYGDTYTLPVLGTDGNAYQFTAGQKYLVQVDYNQGYGGLVANLSWSASSTAANAQAGTFDVLPSEAVPTNDVVAPTPAFTTVDAAGTQTQDQSYYSFTAEAGDEVALLQWNNVGADSYNLYRSTSASGPFTKVNTSAIAAPGNGAPVTYTDSGLTDGTKYYYILTGVDAGGETPVTLSSGVTSGLTTSATPMSQPPATPTGVAAAMVDATTTGVEGEVSFNAVQFATGYTVQRSTSGTAGSYVNVTGGTFTTTGATVLLSDSDPTLNANNSYYYQVIADGTTQNSAASTPVQTNAAGPALSTEGPVEVDVIAARSGSGTTSSIPNFGNQGGVFNAVGGAITVGPVTDGNGVPHPALQFNGTNAASSSFNSPSDLNGNSSRSVEVWVDNPTIDNIEETLVSWSHRGGNPDGSNMSLSYGSQYGVGLWGGEYDLQWTNTAPGVMGPGAAPAANTWHYLVFTYDGTNDNVYVDGQLYLQQPVANGGLATFAGFPINLAAQNSATIAGDVTATLNASADLASVRIEGGALTSSDVSNNYVVGVPGRPASTSAPTTAPTLNPITSSGQLNLTWSYDPNAFSYDVYRSDPAHPTPVAIATGLTTLRYNDTAISAGVTYTYYVTSVNSIGQGPPSNSEAGSVNTLTTAPTLNAALPGNDTVTLSWSSDPNASTYDLYRSDPAHPTPVALASGIQGLTFTDTSVVNGTTYTYYLTSVNAVGQGPHSNSVTATPALPGPFQPVNILNHHDDSNNDGLNASESVLTPANVNATDFGKQYTDTLDGGDVIAEPLYMQNVNITAGTSQGDHSVVFVATEADGLYALDANTGAVLWHDNFTNITDPTNLTPTTGVTTILQSDINGNPDVGSQLGILATPAIDAQTGVMYLNANTKEIRGDGKHFVQRLWAISIDNGVPVMNPTLIGDTIAPNGLDTTGPYTYVAGPIIDGTGNNDPTTPTPTYPDTDAWTAAPGGQSGYVIGFNAIEQMERTAVTLINGSIYLGFASHGDDGPYYGWVLGYNASTLALDAVFNTTPTYEPASIVGQSQPFQSLGGVWGSGTIIASDGTNLYLATGNGAFNGDPSNFGASGFPIDHDYGDSVLKLTPDPTSSSTNQNGNGWGLRVSDYFTPSNQLELNDLDLDLGSGGVAILPNNVLDAAGHPMLAIGGKESRLYLIDIDNMGKYNYNYPTDGSTPNPAPYDRVVAEYANDGLNNGNEQMYTTPAYYDGNLYVGVNGSPAIELNVAAMVAGDVTPLKTNLDFGYPGETFIVSADGNSDGIAWAENPGASDLLAYDASNFTTPIYDSNTNNGDSLGGSIHFHVPTEANGMVYAGSRGGGLGGYGLKLSYLMSNPSYFAAPAELSAVAVSPTDAYLAWTSNSALATEFRIDRAPHGTTTWTTLAYVGNSNTSYNDTTISGSTVYDYRVVAISGANSTAASNTAPLSEIPPYITPSSGAAFAYNDITGALTLTSGTLTFTADSATDTADPEITLTASGAGATVVFNTSQHLAGLTLSGGATASMTSLGAARTHSNHNVLVIGALGAAADPTFSIDSVNGSKLDLADNDLIVHTGSNDTNGKTELSVVQSLAATGRNVAPGGVFDGTWNGNGLTSSSAASVDAGLGYEQNVLAVEDLSDMFLGSPTTDVHGTPTWQAGSTTEPLGTNDIIVKYTYNGDLSLDGAVDGDAATIFSSYFDNGATVQNDYAFGDLNGDGRVDGNDATIFSSLFDNGMPVSGLPPL